MRHVGSDGTLPVGSDGRWPIGSAGGRPIGLDARPPVRRIAVTALVAAALLAGCGTSQRSPGTGIASPDARASSGGLLAGSRAKALATSMLSRLVLPAGARPAEMRSAPPLARTPASTIGAAHVVDVHRVFSLRQPVPATSAFLLAHAPRSMHQTGNGQGGGPTGITMMDLTYTPDRVPAGVFQADLVIAMIPGTAGSWLRADAEVVPFPARSPAEYLNPARFHAVIISASRANHRPHTMTRTITSADVIARLAKLLNGLRAAPALAQHCPAIVAPTRWRSLPQPRPGQVSSSPRRAAGMMGFGWTARGNRHCGTRAGSWLWL